ncbi:MAG: YkgJ family cysteine cluster protein [Vicinamibacteria bacterium]
MTGIELVYPQDVRFTCSRCGDCCRGWNVMLGPGEIERLEELDWKSTGPDLVGAPVAAAVPGDSRPGRLAIARREDGACIYLGSENQCRIHESFGEAAKPLLCRLYPFGFFAVGDRVGVDVSFACRAVSEDRGEPLARRVPEWSRLVHDRIKAQDRHRFSKKYDVSPDLLWELEHHLVDLLSDESLSLLDRVRAVYEFNRLATTSDPATAAARTLRQVLAKGIPRQIRERPVEPDAITMDETSRAVFHYFLYLTLNPTPVELFTLPKKARDREAGFRVRAAEGFRFPEAHPFLDNRESKATFGAVARIRAEGLVQGPEAAQLARYLEAKVLGQRFLREGDDEIPFLEAVPRLLLLLPMVLWTAKALACERGADAAKDEDLRRALRLVDRSYGEIRLSTLPPRSRKAWQHVLLETDLPVTACLEVLAYNAR